MPRKTKQNDITSPELLSQINPKNKRLMKDYLLYLKSIQRAETTINSYQNDLEIFFVWLFQNADNKFFASITKRDVIAFQNYLLNENGNSPARVRRIKAILSSLSNYIENVLDDDDEFKGFKNIIHKIESPVNQPVREKTVLSEDDISQLLNYLVEKKRRVYLHWRQHQVEEKANWCASKHLISKRIIFFLVRFTKPQRLFAQKGVAMVNIYMSIHLLVFLSRTLTYG